MTINEIQDELIEEFSLFGDWMEKYENIIQMGKELPLINAQYKTDDNIIKAASRGFGYTPITKKAAFFYS